MGQTLRPELDGLVQLLREENVGMLNLKWRDNQCSIGSAVGRFIDMGNVVTNIELRIAIERLYSTPAYSDTSRRRFWNTTHPLSEFTNPENPHLERLPHATLSEAARAYLATKYSVPVNLEWGGGGVRASQQVIYYRSKPSNELTDYLRKRFRLSQVTYRYKDGTVST